MPAFMLNSDRIVGGVDAPSMIPWQVSVRSGTFTFCGATILDASTILCAAHCFYQSSASGKSIRAGSTQKSSGGQVYTLILKFLGDIQKTNYLICTRSETSPKLFGIQTLDKLIIPIHWIMTLLFSNWKVLWN